MTTVNVTPAPVFAWSRMAPYVFALSAAAGVIGLLVHRNSTLFFAPELWAEDIWIYFVDDRLWGPAALLKVYAGYVQIGSRLVAYVTGLFPPIYAPRLYATFFIAAILAVAVIVYTSSAFVGFGKTLAAIALIGAPAASETFFAMCYLQWAMAPVLAIALYERPTGWLRSTILIVFAALVGLSAPFLVISAPLVIFKLWLERSRYAIALAALTALCCALQVPAMLKRAAAPSLISMVDRELLSTTILYRWAIGDRSISSAATFAIATATVLLLVWYFVKTRSINWQAKLYFLGHGAIMLFVSCMAINVVDSHPYGPFARYFYPPIVMLVWTFISIEQDQRRAAISLPAIAAFIIATYTMHAKGLAPAYRDTNWNQTVECLQTSLDTCRVPVNPWNYSPGLLPSDKQLSRMTTADRISFKSLPKN